MIEEQKEGEGKSRHIPYGPCEKYFKGSLDLMLSALALVVLSPVLLVTTILVGVKLDSPVLFSQEHPGRDEKIFMLRKFKSMTVDENGDLLPDEERLAPFRKFLHPTSLDKIVEFWNVVKGEMSLVGSRSLLVEYLPRYNERQHHGHDIRLGLTSLSALKKRNLAFWAEKFEDDVRYAEKITFSGDLKIILDTVKIVFKRFCHNGRIQR